MKALVKKHSERGLWLEDIPEPEVGINDVLIRVDRTGICGTDLHIFKWDEWAQATIPVPMTVGHEFVGEIVELGSNVQDYKVGQIVSAEGHVVCGHCRNCMAGRRHLCIRSKGIGVNRTGAFAEYISVPQQNIWLHRDGVDLDVASVFDPLGNATHTALSFDLLGEDVLITGAGPIGIMAIGIAKHAGARSVVITDVNEYRLELARKMGATVALDVSKQSIRDIWEPLGIHEGFDVGLEMSGVPSATQEMINNMSHGGKIAMLGIPAQQLNIDWNKVVFNMLTIKGIYGREMFETWYKMSVMVESGLDIAPAITHKFHYSEFQKAFELMESGNSGKIILDWKN